MLHNDCCFLLGNLNCCHLHSSPWFHFILLSVWYIFSLLSLHGFRSRSSASSQSRIGTHWRFLTEETIQTPCSVASQVSSRTSVSTCTSPSVLIQFSTYTRHLHLVTGTFLVTHPYLGYLNQHNGLIGFYRGVFDLENMYLLANTYSILGCWGEGVPFAWLQLQQCWYMTDAVVIPFPCYNTFTFQVIFFPACRLFSASA